MDYKERLEQAKAFYERGLDRVRSTPEPEGQKFPCGSRVKITEGRGALTGGREGAVLYTYAHAYGGSDVKSYSLDVDGYGAISWYDESQLTQV